MACVEPFLQNNSVASKIATADFEIALRGKPFIRFLGVNCAAQKLHNPLSKQQENRSHEVSYHTSYLGFLTIEISISGYHLSINCAFSRHIGISQRKVGGHFDVRKRVTRE